MGEGCPRYHRKFSRHDYDSTVRKRSKISFEAINFYKDEKLNA